MAIKQTTQQDGIEENIEEGVGESMGLVGKRMTLQVDSAYGGWEEATPKGERMNQSRLMQIFEVQDDALLSSGTENMWTFLIRSAKDDEQKELIQSAYAYANSLKAEQRELANEVILANRWQKTYEEREALRGLQGVQEGVAALVVVCHGRAREAGWWSDLETGEPVERNVGELLCLVHSEVSEAMEGHRKGLMDDKLPHRPMIEVELADAVVRIADLCGGLGLDLAGAIVEKLAYNASREDHRIETRRAEGGKKF